MLLFLGLTYLEGEFRQQYPYFYIGKIILVAATMFYYRETWKDIRFDVKWLLPSVVLGAALCAVWVWGERNVAYPHFLGERSAFDPTREIVNPVLQGVFLGFRFLGLVLLVPVMEELFWRSFLLRYATRPDFEKLRIGEFSLAAFCIVASLFAAAHPEWLVALVFAVAIGLWVRYTRSIFACVVCHATTNLALGAYVVARGDWAFL
jgi:CAAX prenyl protease-like protein